MAFREIFQMALQNIRNNKLRAVLTLLIISFGIMSLVGILTAIDALAGSLNDSFSGLGANSFSIERIWGNMHSNHNGRQSKAGERVSYDQAMGFKERYHFQAKVSVSFEAGDNRTIKWADQKTNPNVAMYGIGYRFGRLLHRYPKLSKLFGADREEYFERAVERHGFGHGYSP